MVEDGRLGWVRLEYCFFTVINESFMKCYGKKWGTYMIELLPIFLGNYKMRGSSVVIH